MEQIAPYLATAATIAAASITASNLGSRITGYGFIVFTVGSIAWFVVGLTSGQPPLMWTNAVLTLLNLFGVWRWLGRQSRLEEGGSVASRESRERPTETLFPVSLMARSEVVSKDGSAAGHCVDAMAGCVTGRIAYVVVSGGGVAGVGETLRRLPWSDCSVENERVTMAIPMSRFCALEEIEPDHWPAR